MPSSTDKTTVKSRNYDAVAGVYETIAHIYSFGLIRRAKMAQLRYLKRGARVLYLGAGSGEDAIAAARAGARVTAIDLSSRMIERLRRRLMRKGARAELIAGDALALTPDPLFDVVAGNYFFNVFGPKDMPVVLVRATSYLRPGGLLMIADMAPPRGLLGPLAWLYLKFGLSFFWLLGLASQHPIYDYRVEAQRIGLEEVAVHDHRLLGIGPALYRTLIFRKPEKGA
ncbi:methyltransferase domain-containing protein [Aliihoeflea aestuarii]|uniref:class I SAM-dependent methyltransferase n=1 Tax=Aliihoeflea aestuarii TaxID=453840 RepID=UPI0020935366|nr:class I SAM-dependent methyltransferase [Aliihoeflea aestuarii]MCO6390603.1 methyltransferase domain-containing protein [Aliihoeflea aestuarii]